MAIAYTAASYGELHNQANSGTSSTVTIPAGTTLFCLAVIGYNADTNYFSGRTAGTPSVGGEELTLAALIGDDGDKNKIAIFYKVNPTAGTNLALAWNWSGSGTWADGGHYKWASFTGVDTVTPIRDATGTGAEHTSDQSSTTTLATPTITASSEDLLFAAGYVYDTNAATAATMSPCTQLDFDNYDGSSGMIGYWYATGNSAVTIDPSGNSGNTLWISVLGVSFRSGVVITSGIAAATLSLFVGSVGGVVVSTGIAAATLPAQVSSSAALCGENAAASATLPILFAVASGMQPLQEGQAAATLPIVFGVMIVAVGANSSTADAVIPTIVGDADGDFTDIGEVIVLASAVLPSSTGQGVVAMGVLGPAAATTSTLGANAAGLSTLPVTGAATLPASACAGTGVSGQTGTAAAAIPSVTSSVSGDAYLPGESVGVGSATLPLIGSSGLLDVDLCGYGVGILPAITAQASGAVAVPTAIDLPVVVELQRMRQTYELPNMRETCELPRIRQTYELKAA